MGNKINFARLKRPVAVAIPSMFTIANMGLGFFAILAASDKKFAMAGWCIIGAILMDILDGKIARLVHGESRFGMEIDSFADWISFGIAPAYIMYRFLLKDCGFWGYPVAFIYVLCGGFRLARFNITAHSGEGPKTYFQGLPIPGAAGILASFILVYTMLETDQPLRVIGIVMHHIPLVYTLMPFIMLGLSFLMISKVRFAASKQQSIFKPTSFKGLFLMLIVLFFIIAYPQNSLFLVFTVYVVSGVIEALWRAFAGIGSPSLEAKHSRPLGPKADGKANH